MPKGFFDIEDTITRGDETIKNNIKKVIMTQEELDTYNSYAEKVITTTDVKKAIHMIYIISKSNMIAFDYETTGKKPFRKGHRIFSASISNGSTTFSFPFFNGDSFLLAWKELMLSPIKKICHNAKFESVWSKVILGYYPKNIIADTMINAHVINNRNKVGLKPLTKQYFNVYGYEDSISNFLSADLIEKKKYGANAFNRIDKAPLNDLLLYGGLDSLFTYLLYEKQLEELDKHTSIGAKFFTSATLDLARIEVEGFLFDIKQAKESFTEIEHKMKTIESDTFNMKEMKLWDKNSPFRFTAAADLSYLLFDKMKYKLSENNKTETGKAKMDVETLEKYKLPLVKNVLEWRKWKKIKDTYFSSLMRECIDNKIHASIRLENVGTYRSSCSDPNLQNQPARDEVAMNLIRKCFITNPGCKLGEYDYKAMEAVVIACYNKDPRWIEYVTDPNNDMHRDMAAKIFIKDKKDVTKNDRFLGKNGFVFPTVYGSYWKNTAVNLWDCEKETKEHLKNEGIKTLNDFREHIHEVEDWFWQDQFPVGYEWMNKTLADYEKKGYIDLYTGFRCYAPMSRNQVINYRVQGTASHCKLWTLQHVQHDLLKNKMKSKILLEIHDSIIPNIYPKEEEYLDHIVWDYGTQKIKEYWDFLIVPLFIEKKISKISGNWASMENMGLLKGENK
jgi:DNA polymerase I